jgi:hypothetical protein
MRDIILVLLALVCELRLYIGLNNQFISCAFA